ncbi:MAG TPA: WD40 repeat domain-containing protein, partial [Aggregatilineales bacterium]|nr:WD40 repeat domain-containing protein [Aggregatilineales bacterium]
MKYRLSLLAFIVFSVATTVFGDATGQIADNPIITDQNIEQVTQLAMFGRGSIREIAYSPDSQTLAVATSVGLWLYDVDAPDTPPRYLDVGLAWDMAYSPDGQFIIAGLNDTVRIWDT